MRRWLEAAFFAALAAAWLFVSLRAQEPAAQTPAVPVNTFVGDDGTEQIDPRDVRIRELEQQLLAKDAELVHQKADVAFCEANAEQTKRDLQSVMLSDEVVKLLNKHHDLLGGNWMWDNVQRRIVPAKEEKKP